MKRPMTLWSGDFLFANTQDVGEQTRMYLNKYHLTCYMEPLGLGTRANQVALGKLT